MRAEIRVKMELIGCYVTKSLCNLKEIANDGYDTRLQWSHNGMLVSSIVCFHLIFQPKIMLKKACRLSQLVRAIAESNASVKLGLTAYLGNNEDQQLWIYQWHKQQPSDRMGRPDTGSPRLWGLLS